MADVSILKVGTESYNIKDKIARDKVDLFDADMTTIETKVNKNTSDITKIGTYILETETLVIKE